MTNPEDDNRINKQIMTNPEDDNRIYKQIIVEKEIEQFCLFPDYIGL